MRAENEAEVPVWIVSVRSRTVGGSESPKITKGLERGVWGKHFCPLALRLYCPTGWMRHLSIPKQCVESGQSRGWYPPHPTPSHPPQGLHFPWRVRVRGVLKQAESLCFQTKGFPMESEETMALSQRKAVSTCVQGHPQSTF